MRDVIPGNEAIISLSDKGQIYIPSGLLKLWELSAKSGELQILVNRDGSATIRPVDPETKITYSYLLELNEDLCRGFLTHISLQKTATFLPVKKT